MKPYQVGDNNKMIQHLAGYRTKNLVLGGLQWTYMEQNQIRVMIYTPRHHISFKSVG
jgi:hypothetical protein